MITAVRLVVKRYMQEDMAGWVCFEEVYLSRQVSIFRGFIVGAVFSYVLQQSACSLVFNQSCCRPVFKCSSCRLKIGNDKMQQRLEIF